jgi:hypothetical protein
MSQLNVTAMVNGVGSVCCSYASVIGALIVATLSLEALIMLWKSAKRARTNDMRMLSNAVVLELVNRDLFFDGFIPAYF